MLDFISTNVFDTFVRKELVNQVDDIENLSMFSKLLDTQLKFDNDYHTELKNYYLTINEEIYTTSIIVFGLFADHLGTKQDDSEKFSFA